MGEELFNDNIENYDILLEQYKLYINSVEKNSDRRISVNKLYLTINIWLLSFLWAVIQYWDNKLLPISLLIISIVWIISSIIFWYLINSYKQLNSWKFKVIHEIEKKLPLNLYSYEWDILWKWENKWLYYPFSHIEKSMPIIFGVIYSIIFLSIVIYYFIRMLCFC